MKEVAVISRFFRRLFRRHTPLAPVLVDEDSIPPSHNTGRDFFFRLQSALKETEFFLKPDCSRQDLMTLIGVNKNQITRIIRNYGGFTNVSSYVNSLRLDYAIDLMKRHPEKKMKEIAVESGFESFQNFNRVFKKHFSDTPYHYFRTIFS